MWTLANFDLVCMDEDDWNRDRRSKNVSRLIRVIVMSAKNEM